MIIDNQIILMMLRGGVIKSIMLNKIKMYNRKGRQDNISMQNKESILLLDSKHIMINLKINLED